MIPYFLLESFSIGPVTIQMWGLMVALGILFGAYTSAKFAEKKGIEKSVIYDGVLWIIIGSFFVARLFHVFLYEPGFYFENPLEMFMVWHGGLSVMGGFFGAVIGYTLFIRKKSLPWVKTADKFIYGLPIGLGIGRIGCFLVHDHPGTATDFILGLQQPVGSAIHEHGLYLSINGFILALVFYILSKKPRPDGFYFKFFLIWYGVIRFLLDFYRVADSTYYGLTPAQYMSFLMIVIALIWQITDIKNNKLQASTI